MERRRRRANPPPDREMADRVPHCPKQKTQSLRFRTGEGVVMEFSGCRMCRDSRYGSSFRATFGTSSHGPLVSSTATFPSLWISCLPVSSLLYTQGPPNSS